MRRFALALASLALVTLGTVPVAEAGGARDYIVRYRESAVAGNTAAVRVMSGGARFQVRRVDHAKVNRRVRKAKSWGVKPRHVFRNGIGGFAARLTPAQLRKLRDDPSVASIEIDAPVSIAKDTVEAGVVSRGEFSRQQMPSGVKRIYADRQPLARIGDKVDLNLDIAVLDTGIAAHPDLRIGGGYNCSPRSRDPFRIDHADFTDRYGHGTHVAGTIAARDNARGVVGVVPGARVWAIKVLGDNGHGQTSDIVCGLQWMIGQQLSAGGPRFIAANMSIAGPQRQPNTACGVGTSDSYHQLMCQAMDAGIVFAVAAANDSRVVNQRPAIFDEPITVAALADYDGRPGANGRQRSVCPWYSADSDDTWANFSNWGAAVDIVAPGKCILSTFKNRRYAWMSGTSMATPHVTGAIALYRLRYPNAQPQQIKQALYVAGTRDWRTSSAPDGRPYRLLQVRSLSTPPTFVIAAVARPSTPLGGEGAERGVRVTLSRRSGHYRPVRVTVSQPDAVGSETLRIRERGGAGTLWLQGTSALQTGSVTVTVRATDGEVSDTQTVNVPIDADPPVVDISYPTGALRIQGSGSRSIRATAADSYTGIARRTLQRRRAVQSGPMACDDVTWADDGSPRTITGSGPWTSGDLRSGYCYRWNVTAYDRAGNATVGRTAIVWTDVSSPLVPVLDVSGDAVPRGTSVWFRAGTSGRFTLESTSRDPHSGVTEAVIGSVSGSGWSTTSPSVDVASGVTATASREFAFGSGSGASSITVRATNGVDRTRRTTISFKPDGRAPSISVTSPSKLTFIGSPSTTIRYRASDSGAGVGTVSARRQRSPLRSKSEGCATSWESDGSQATVGASTFSVDDLERGFCYRWIIRVTDRVGHARSRTTAPVAIDPTRPVVDQVRVSLDRGTVRTTGSIPVRVAWRLRVAPVGSTSFSLARTTNGGSSWSGIDHPNRRSRVQNTALGDGTGTTISVRGRSTTGSSSEWAVSRRVTARLVQEGASSVDRTSGWRRVPWASASGGYRLVSSTKRAKVTYRFEGTSVGIVAALSRSFGTATVRIDGKVAATIDLGKSPAAMRRIVWTRNLHPGRHSISVQVRSGTVVLDGFVVTRSTSGDRR